MPPLNLDAGPNLPPGATIAPPKECNPCNDFTVVPQPFIPEGVTVNPAQFGPYAGPSAGGPCISDPPNGALLPYNWTRPRIKWKDTGAGAYEVRLSAVREGIEFVAYTNRAEFYVPRAVWFGDPERGTKGLAANNWGEDITVTVRGPTGGASQVKFQTAPVPAGGSLVYWVTDLALEAANNGKLMGFQVGDESSIDALTLQDIEMPSYDQGGNQVKQNQQERCIGCHTSTPDGTAVAFNDGWPWNGMIASVASGATGKLPDYVSPGGRIALNMPWQGVMTFSKGRWSEAERYLVTTTSQTGDITWESTNPGNNNATTETQLIWINLAAPRPDATEAAMLGTKTWELKQTVFPQLPGVAFGVIARNGDPRAAVAPDWSHDASQVVYTSSTTAQDGHIGLGNDTDIYTVPFNNGAGGDAAPVPPAAQKGVVEYYPDLSADDRFVAFNRIGSVPASAIYSRPEGEIWIAPMSGAVSAAPGETEAGGAIRLRANDGDACGTATSPGLFNSWPKWSPGVYAVDDTGTTYYWLVFSSGRDGKGTFPRSNTYPDADRRFVQLYMAPITVKDGKVTTYPAIYLWNQDPATSNFTPAWDDFTIPEVPEVPEVY